jgi:hypothetical protein
MGKYDTTLLVLCAILCVSMSLKMKTNHRLEKIVQAHVHNCIPNHRLLGHHQNQPQNLSAEDQAVMNGFNSRIMDFMFSDEDILTTLFSGGQMTP